MAQSLIVTPATPLELIRTPDGALTADKYRAIGLIRHPDGVLLRFTERVDNGRVSAGLFRFFKDGDDERESVYFAVHHLQAAHRLLDTAEEHMLRLESEALQRLATARAGFRR